MKTLILALCAFLACRGAFATGGMIGGGDVNFKSLMVCDSKSTDPTFEASPYVWVVKEVDYNGNFISDATLRIVTLDKDLKPVRYYVTHSKELLANPDSKWKFELFRYDIGSSGNYKIGSFIWDELNNSGLITSVQNRNEVEEVQLSNCIFTL